MIQPQVDIQEGGIKHPLPPPPNSNCQLLVELSNASPVIQYSSPTSSPQLPTSPPQLPGSSTTKGPRIDNTKDFIREFQALLVEVRGSKRSWLRYRQGLPFRCRCIKVYKRFCQKQGGPFLDIWNDLRFGGLDTRSKCTCNKVNNPPSLPTSFLTHAHSHSHSRIHAHPRSFTLTLPHSRSPTLALTHTHSHSHSLTLNYTYPRAVTFIALTHILTHSPLLSPPHTYRTLADVLLQKFEELTMEK